MEKFEHQKEGWEVVMELGVLPKNELKERLRDPDEQNAAKSALDKASGGMGATDGGVWSERASAQRAGVDVSTFRKAMDNIDGALEELFREQHPSE
jgi:hypothetical protein